MPLIDKKRAEEVNKAAAERSGDSNKLKPGIYEMKVTGVQGKTTNSGKVAAVITYSDVDSNYAPLDEWFIVGDGGKGEEFLASRLQQAGYDLPPAETLGDLVKFINKNLGGRTFKVAVRCDERIYKKSETEWYKNQDPRVVFIADVKESLTWDVASKGIKPLSAEQQAEWDEYQRSRGLNSGSSRTTAKAVAEPIQLDDEASEEMDLDDDVPGASTPSGAGEKPIAAPKKTAPAKKPAVKAPEPEVEDIATDGGDDELSFLD